MDSTNTDVPYDRNSVILDIFENAEIMNVYKNVTKLGPREVRLARSGSKVSIELSPSLKAIYSWVRQMNHLERNKPEDFLQMELRDNGFDLKNEKKIMRVLLTEDINSIEKIKPAGGAEKIAKIEKKILSSSESFLSFLFIAFFVINWLYSTYVSGGLLEIFFPVILILFIFSIVVDIKFFLFITAILIEIYFVYFSILTASFNILNIFLFPGAVIPYYILINMDKFEKRLDEKLSFRLPDKYRKSGIIGDERVRFVEKTVYAKEKFLNLLKNADTTIDNRCPFCNGYGFNQTEERIYCPRCGGSGKVSYYDRSEGNLSFANCTYCQGTGSVTKYVKVGCSHCFSGIIPSEEFEEELRRRIANLMDEIGRIDDRIKEKIEIVNREIDILNKKISIWNSKTG